MAEKKTGSAKSRVSIKSLSEARKKLRPLVLQEKRSENPSKVLVQRLEELYVTLGEETLNMLERR